MFLYSILLILLTLLYAAALLKLHKGFANLKQGKNKTQPKVSVVIAARNEEASIGCCLIAVLNQTYPKDKLQIIVVDDRSEDRTFEVVKSLAASHRQIKLLQIKDTLTNLAPKKRAIDSGIRHASGEIIVTTDADCQPGPEWISELIKHFEPEVGMVAGFNPYKTENPRPSLFQKILALDYFAMASVAAASAGLNYPVSCTGGNLAYRKKVYQQLGGFCRFGNWVSGDDDFFLEKVRDKTNWKIVYSTHPKTFVPTSPPKNLNEFIQQRIRYASKGRYYKLPVTITLLGLYVLNLLVILGPILLLLESGAFSIWLAAFSMKTLAEHSFLRSGQKLFRCNFNLSVFLLTSILHPIYIVLAGFFGQISGFRWKGEKYSAKTNAKTSLQKSSFAGSSQKTLDILQ